MDVCTDPKITGFLKKGFLLQICLPLVPIKMRQMVWEDEGLIYFNNMNDEFFIADFPLEDEDD